MGCGSDNRIIVSQLILGMQAAPAWQLRPSPITTGGAHDACSVHELKLGRGANGRPSVVALCHVLQTGNGTPAVPPGPPRHPRPF